MKNKKVKKEETMPEEEVLLRKKKMGLFIEIKKSEEIFIDIKIQSDLIQRW